MKGPKAGPGRKILRPNTSHSERVAKRIRSANERSKLRWAAKVAAEDALKREAEARAWDAVKAAQDRVEASNLQISKAETRAEAHRGRVFREVVAAQADHDQRNFQKAWRDAHPVQAPNPPRSKSGKKSESQIPRPVVVVGPRPLEGMVRASVNRARIVSQLLSDIREEYRGAAWTPSMTGIIRFIAGGILGALTLLLSLFFLPVAGGIGMASMLPLGPVPGSQEKSPLSGVETLLGEGDFLHVVVDKDGRLISVHPNWDLAYQDLQSLDQAKYAFSMELLQKSNALHERMGYVAWFLDYIAGGKPWVSYRVPVLQDRNDGVKDDIDLFWAAKGSDLEWGWKKEHTAERKGVVTRFLKHRPDLEFSYYKGDFRAVEIGGRPQAGWWHYTRAKGYKVLAGDKTVKRLSQFTRPYLLAGVKSPNQMSFSMTEDAGLEKATDGAFVIGRGIHKWLCDLLKTRDQAFQKKDRGLKYKTFRKAQSCKVFNGRVWIPAGACSGLPDGGFLKGEAYVSDSVGPWEIKFHRTNIKKEISCTGSKEVFVALDPQPPKTGARSTVQFMINQPHAIGKLLPGWLKAHLDKRWDEKMIELDDELELNDLIAREKVKRGSFTTRLKQLAFQILDHGGSLREQPGLMMQLMEAGVRNIVDMDAYNVRVPIPCSFKTYVLSHTVASWMGLKGLPDVIPAGQQWYCPTTKLTVVSDHEYTTKVIPNHGGSDLDDTYIHMVRQWKGKVVTLVLRSPNDFGEYTLWEVMNPGDLPWCGDKVTVLDDKTQLPRPVTEWNFPPPSEEFPIDEPHPRKGQEYTFQDVQRDLDKLEGSSGGYANAVMLYRATRAWDALDKNPRLAVSMEQGIDYTQQTGDDRHTRFIMDYCRTLLLRIKESKCAVPKLMWECRKAWLSLEREEQKGFNLVKNHWVDKILQECNAHVEEYLTKMKDWICKNYRKPEGIDGTSSKFNPPAGQVRETCVTIGRRYQSCWTDPSICRDKNNRTTALGFKALSRLRKGVLEELVTSEEIAMGVVWQWYNMSDLYHPTLRIPAEGVIYDDTIFRFYLRYLWQRTISKREAPSFPTDDWCYVRIEDAGGKLGCFESRFPNRGWVVPTNPNEDRESLISRLTGQYGYQIVSEVMEADVVVIILRKKKDTTPSPRPTPAPVPAPVDPSKDLYFVCKDLLLTAFKNVVERKDLPSIAKKLDLHIDQLTVWLKRAITEKIITELRDGVYQTTSCVVPPAPPAPSGKDDFAEMMKASPKPEVKKEEPKKESPAYTFIRLLSCKEEKGKAYVSFEDDPDWVDHRLSRQPNKNIQQHVEMMLEKGFSIVRDMNEDTHGVFSIMYDRMIELRKV